MPVLPEGGKYLVYTEEEKMRVVSFLVSLEGSVGTLEGSVETPKNSIL